MRGLGVYKPLNLKKRELKARPRRRGRGRLRPGESQEERIESSLTTLRTSAISSRESQEERIERSTRASETTLTGIKAESQEERIERTP